MMSKLVEDGRTNLLAEVLTVESESHMGFVVDDDPIRGDAKIVQSTVIDRHALVDAEEGACSAAATAWGAPLNNNKDVVHLVFDPGGQAGENRFDLRFKLIDAHPERLQALPSTREHRAEKGDD